jgi:hypothetical protein
MSKSTITGRIEGEDHAARHREANVRIDDAYREKYHDSPYLGPMIGPRARAATVKIMPRGTNA